MHRSSAIKTSCILDNPNFGLYEIRVLRTNFRGPEWFRIIQSLLYIYFRTGLTHILGLVTEAEGIKTHFPWFGISKKVSLGYDMKWWVMHIKILWTFRINKKSSKIVLMTTSLFYHQWSKIKKNLSINNLLIFRIWNFYVIRGSFGKGRCQVL